MSSELKDLYQEVIVEHSKNPRNFGKLEGAPHAEGFNPLCGDHLTLYVKLAGDKVEQVAFEGNGCAISKASASLMTQAAKGKTKQELLALFEKVHGLLTHGPGGAVKPEELGKLAVLSGVWEFPARVKCASLAWHTLKSVLEGKGETISTE